VAKKEARKTAGRKPAEPVAINSASKLINQLTDKTKKALEALRTEFRGYTEAFGLALQKRAKLADPLNKLYHQCASEVSSGLTFVKFLQMLDPSIPDHRDPIQKDGREIPGYVAHSTYQAGIYLQRLTRKRGNGAEGEGEGEGGGRRRARTPNMLEIVARTLRMILPMLSNADAAWKGISEEFGLDEQQTAKLKTAADAAQPLFAVPAPARKVAPKIVHVAANEPATATQVAQRAKAS
jgi:hypothetical protein